MASVLHPFKAFQGGEEAEVIPVGLAWAPCSSQAFLQLGAVACVLLWPQKDGVRAASSEPVSFHPVFDLTTEGLFGEAWLVWARQPGDWSLNKLLD